MSMSLAPPRGGAWVCWRRRVSHTPRVAGGTRVGFASRGQPFDELVGEKSFEVLIEGDSTLATHEGAAYNDGHLYFTNKPFRLPPADPKSGRVMLRGEIKSLNLSSGAVRTLWRSDALANGVTVGPDDRLYVCFQGEARPSTNGSASGERKHRAGIYSCELRGGSGAVIRNSDWREVATSWSDNQPLNSPFDVAVRQDGSVWFTDPSYAAAQGVRDPPVLGDWVWRHDSVSGAMEVVADGFVKPNGLAFSPDEAVLYVTDTGHATGRQGAAATDPAGPRSIYAFDVEPGSRRLSGRRLLYVSDAGVPDSIAVDGEGRIYSGNADGVHVLSSAGELLGKILVRGWDGGVAHLCFGKGPEHGSTLFVLAEAAIIAVKLNTAVSATASTPSHDVSAPKWLDEADKLLRSGEGGPAEGGAGGLEA